MGQHLKLAIRSIVHGRIYSLVSLAGLSIAIATMMLVALLIQRESSFDRGFSDAETIYRVVWQNTGTGDRFATMFNPFSPQMKIEFDEVEEAARLGVFELTLQRPAAERGEQGPAAARYENIAMVDPAIFDLFDFEFVAGGPDGLQAPNRIVLSRAAAERYFADEDPMGQTLLLENDVVLTVAAVLDEIPLDTHITTHFFAPIDTLRALFDGAGFLDNWGSDSLYHYVRLGEDADPEALASQLPAFLERQDHEWPLGTVAIELQALTSIHFTTDLQDDMPVRDKVLNVTKAPRQASDLVLFASAALFLVLVASFNFMNLQIAQSINRGRQMGMLKVFGANQRQVSAQMLLESVVLCLFALLMSLVLIELSLDGFGRLLGVALDWRDLLSPGLAGFALLLTIGLGLLSGAYPALLMANQKPSQVMKGEFSLGQGADKTRSALVFLQFAVSVVLIIVSAVIWAQIRFSLQTPLGFTAENVAVIQMDRSSRQNFEGLRARLLSLPGVEYVSRGSIVPSDHLSDGMSLTVEGTQDELDMRLAFVGHDYLETLGIELVAGRAYGPQFGGDAFQIPSPEAPYASASVIINETAARRGGWLSASGADAAIGQQMGTEHTIDGTRMTMEYTVVGVARDVHFRSLRSEVVPMAYFLSDFGGKAVVRFAPDTAPVEAERLIQDAWSSVAAGKPLRMGWLADSVNGLYAQEHRSLRLISGMAVLAMVVACIGLFAVASLATGLRTREIGIRKILGAGVREIVNLLSWQFVKPVMLASLIALPIGWIFLVDWLQHFAYRVDLSWMYFALPGAAAVAVAWLTVASQAWRVAHANPIHALRYE